jgi:rhamnosyltransferase
MDENLGIAAAMNAGIDRANARGFSEVLLLDHDSIPAPDMVERLAEAKARLQAEGIRVAAVGPEFRDEKYPGVLPFYRLDGWRITRRSCAGSAPGSVIRAECLITSGSLISIEAVVQIGPLESSLFVDYVDIEWGFRASSRGYLCFGVCGAVLDHQLGDAVMRIMGVSAPVRSPLRHYYLFRNALLMFRRSYVPLRWKVGDAYRLLLKYVFYSLVARPRLDHWRMMTLGIAHAALNRSGRLV